MTLQFDNVPLADLNAATRETLDALPFGVIGFAADGRVTVYNAFESAGAGLRAANVLGRHLFDEVAPCMNNFMVAQRFEDEATLDATLPYVLTLAHVGAVAPAARARQRDAVRAGRPSGGLVDSLDDEALEQLQAEHEALLSFVYMSPVGIVRSDLEGRIDMMNPLASQ